MSGGCKALVAREGDGALCAQLQEKGLHGLFVASLVVGAEVEVKVGDRRLRRLSSDDVFNYSRAKT